MVVSKANVKKDSLKADLILYKDLYKQTENERKILSKDYTDLVKKFNVIEQENANLRKENERLRNVVNGRMCKS